MAEEIQEAVQIIRVAYDGIEIAMKVGSGGLGALQKAMDFFKGMLDYEKSIGKTSMRKLLKRGGDLQVFQFRVEDVRKFERLAKKYGILYATLPDINKGDGKTEVLFHAEAVPRINILLQKLGVGKIGNFDDYLKNGDDSSLDKLLEFLQAQKPGNGNFPTTEEKTIGALADGTLEKAGLYAIEKKSFRIENMREAFRLEERQAGQILRQLTAIGLLEPEADSGSYKAVMEKKDFLSKLQGFSQLLDRVQAIAASKNPNLVDVTLSKTLIAEENDKAIKTRVPGTWGEHIRYLWVEKPDAMEIHDGKTWLTFLDKEKDYELYDEKNQVAEVLKGTDLYSRHYDQVDEAVRERYERVQSRIQSQENGYPVHNTLIRNADRIGFTPDSLQKR